MLRDRSNTKSARLKVPSERADLSQTEDVRGDLTVHQPLEQPDRAINSVTRQASWLKIEAVLDALDHRLGDGNLGYTIGACALGVDDDSGLVVDQIVGVISKKWISILPRNPSRLRISQRDLFWRL